MEIVNTETVPGEEIAESLGVVRGNTVRARNVGRDITQSIRNITGGELKAYSELLSDARDEALERMVEDAESVGADAVADDRTTAMPRWAGGVTAAALAAKESAARRCVGVWDSEMQ